MASRFYASQRTSKTISKTITATASKYPNENQGLRLRLTSSPSVVDHSVRWTLLGMTPIRKHAKCCVAITAKPHYLVPLYTNRETLLDCLSW